MSGSRMEVNNAMDDRQIIATEIPEIFIEP
jgi:hypothetical protein